MESVINIYIKVHKNIEVSNKKICIGELCKTYCSDCEIKNKVEKIVFCTIEAHPKAKVRYAFSVIDIVEKITSQLDGVNIVNMGENDFIIDYIDETSKSKPVKKAKNFVRILVISIIMLFGSAYAIMAYNNDVGITEIYEKIYEIFIGNSGNNTNVLEITYSIGLTLGIVVFYNHFGRKRFTSDPTPLEVEMNDYEDQIDDTLIAKQQKGH